MSIVYDLLDATGSIITPTITLANLANSATVGRQSTVITLAAANRVPSILDIEFTVAIAATAPANDKSVYLFMARSLDETAYEVGPPAIGASDAAFTFTNSPVGGSATPTDLLLIGAITLNAASETRRRTFQLLNPPPKFGLVVLNYSGAALAASGSAIQIRKRWSEIV